MYLYALIVLWNGYKDTTGEVQGYFRTKEEAIKRGLELCSGSGVENVANFNVYKCVY